MAQVQRLNFKFTVADTDHMLKLARAAFSADEIAAKFPNTTAAEVIRICDEARQFIRTRKSA